MAQLTLVLGGVRSGKSCWAEQLAAAHPPVTYLATALVGAQPDSEMSRRIDRHRQRRARQQPPWHTVEEPWDVAAAVSAHGGTGCLLLECLSLWVTNLLLGMSGREGLTDEAILAEGDAVIAAAQRVSARVIVVSSEVGCGLLPSNALARRFGDVLGEMNQRFAAAATEVYGCLAGIPVRVKPNLSVVSGPLSVAKNN
jgi:adenosylcobinamide kinase/adenosylcobinamide-phosphate guanylyltransferase